MAFVDEIRIHALAGHGGPGVVRWSHTKEKAKNGPSGGDGGRGGDIILLGVRDLGALASYRFTKKFRAENGKPGGSDNKHGKDAPPIILRVPVGTVATNVTSKETFEVLAEGEQHVVFKGGAGGFGNAHYKSSTNQNPRETSSGKSGQGGDIVITLKIIADAGLVGYPNAGKSSLLNAVTRASSKVGAYPFTTLDPHLGDFYGHLLADIPGLIEGASSGRGLGSKFLRHIERTGLLIHLISAEQEDPVTSYKNIRKELEAFGQGLSEKQELIVLSKADLIPTEKRGNILKSMEDAIGKEVVLLSVNEPELLKEFSDRLTKELSLRKGK